MDKEKDEFVKGRKFDLKSASDNFYTDVSIIASEAYELFVEKTDYPEEYKKIIFKEILRATLSRIYLNYEKQFGNT